MLRDGVGDKHIREVEIQSRRFWDLYSKDIGQEAETSCTGIAHNSFNGVSLTIHSSSSILKSYLITLMIIHTNINFITLTFLGLS